MDKRALKLKEDELWNQRYLPLSSAYLKTVPPRCCTEEKVLPDVPAWSSVVLLSSLRKQKVATRWLPYTVLPAILPDCPTTFFHL